MRGLCRHRVGGATAAGMAAVVFLAGCGGAQHRGQGHASTESAPLVPVSTAPPPPTGVPRAPGLLDAISCPTPQRCVAAGSATDGAGLVDDSTDGGGTWQAGAIPASTPPLSGVACPTSSFCVAVGGPDALVSTDGGVSWSGGAVAAVQVALTSVACPSATRCIASGTENRPDVGGTEGVVYASDDAGHSWSSANVPAWVPGLFSVSCLSETRCAAVGGTVVVTSDAGATWRNEPVAGGIDALTSIACPTTVVCLAVGPNAAGASDPSAMADFISTSDGAATFARRAFPAASASVWTLACDSSSFCLASGRAATPGGTAPLFVSDDGGTTWSPGTAPPGMVGIAALVCPAAGTCLGVGRGLTSTGAVVATHNGGVSWSAGVLP